LRLQVHGTCGCFSFLLTHSKAVAGTEGGSVTSGCSVDVFTRLRFVLVCEVVQNMVHGTFWARTWNLWARALEHFAAAGAQAGDAAAESYNVRGVGSMSFSLFRTSAMMKNVLTVFAVLAVIYSGWLDDAVLAQGRSLAENPELADFFENEVRRLERANELSQYESRAAWERARPALREELFDMLGLSPRPASLPLQASVTGVTEHPDFLVERVHFQSLPGLYVTGNLYHPREQKEPLPTVLYVCGHGQVKKDGVSFGNKTHYHYHGSWFARNGYVCLIIDTLQLGEIEGIHHGTYRMNRWWWNSRGYTPAGVEAWNCIRALDYLQTRPEVDSHRLGVTGRSGGGAYSWWIAALDDRIQCAVPVAGITSLRDHVVNGCIEGHCDCMFMVNTFRWDFARVAALVAPRPLLISNTDKDPIFPLEGVVDIHRQVRHIYRLYEADHQLGLQITEGPHEDTQELHIHAFRWFNRFFRDDKSLIEKTAVRFFDPTQLKVFSELPVDQVNTRIDEIFVPAAEALSADQILERQELLPVEFLARLSDRCFRAWPPVEEVSRAVIVNAVDAAPVDAEPSQVSQITFESQPFVSLRLDIRHPTAVALTDLREVTLHVGSGESQQNPAELTIPGTQARIAVRPGSFGPWRGNEAKQIQIARRFQLLGMTIDGMRVWDIRRALQVLREQCPNLKTLVLRADPGMESLVQLASLYEPPVSQLVLPQIVAETALQPSILNLTRTLPLEILPVLAAQKAHILTQTEATSAPLSSRVTADPRWQGQPIQFSASVSLQKKCDIE